MLTTQLVGNASLGQARMRVRTPGVGPYCPFGNCNGLGLISPTSYWSTARSGGQNGLGDGSVQRWMRGIDDSSGESVAPNRVLWVTGGALALGLAGGFFLGRRR
jgi:hypothetical protein